MKLSPNEIAQVDMAIAGFNTTEKTAQDVHIVTELLRNIVTQSKNRQLSNSQIENLKTVEKRGQIDFEFCTDTFTYPKVYVQSLRIDNKNSIQSLITNKSLTVEDIALKLGIDNAYTSELITELIKENRVIRITCNGIFKYRHATSTIFSTQLRMAMFECLKHNSKTMDDICFELGVNYYTEEIVDMLKHLIRHKEIRQYFNGQAHYYGLTIPSSQHPF